MADDMSTVFSQMNTSLRSINTFLGQILSTLKQGFTQLNSTLNTGFKILAQVSAIGTGSAKIWRDVGLNTATRGGSAGMGAIGEYISSLFSGGMAFGEKTKPPPANMKNPAFEGDLGGLWRRSPIGGSKGKTYGVLETLVGSIGKIISSPFKTAGRVAGGISKGFMGLGGGTGAVMGGVGSALAASLGPISILLQILQPLISAFLEPLEMLTPLMETWGTILSQLLVPIVMFLLEVLEPFTPVIIQLTAVLLPLIELTLSFMRPLLPLIGILASLLELILPLVGWLTNLAGALGYFPAKLEGFITEAMNRIKTVFLTKWIDAITEAVQAFRDKILGAFDNIKNRADNYWDKDQWWIPDRWEDRR